MSLRSLARPVGRDGPRVPRRRTVTVLGAAAVVLALAACGSNLDPQQVASTGAGVPGVPVVAADGTITDPGSVPDGTVAGDDGVVDPGGSVVDPGGVPAPGGGGGGADVPADGDGDGGGGESAADGGVTAGSCDGFDNDQTGVTADTITLANASDISGPVPGIFEAAQLGTRAFVEYYNSTEELCGHKLVVKLLDTRADAGADQQAYAAACDEAFAAVGSMSAFDSGGAAHRAGLRHPRHPLHHRDAQPQQVQHLLRGAVGLGQPRAGRRCRSTGWPRNARPRSTWRCSTSTPARRSSTPRASTRPTRWAG